MGAARRGCPTYSAGSGSKAKDPGYLPFNLLRSLPDEDRIRDHAVDAFGADALELRRHLSKPQRSPPRGRHRLEPRHFLRLAPVSSATAPSVVCAAFSPSRKSLSE